jgi:hypothetical protein
MSKEIDDLLKPNATYEANSSQWEYLYNSYVGGPDYKAGKYLTKYSKEDDNEYQARIEATNLDNHCNSVITVYNSFLFRENPNRELTNIPDFTIEGILEDADYDGRSLDSFMKEVSTWTSVFGHAWVLVVKPDIGAITAADQVAAGVRPYLSLLSPLAVIDWEFTRTAIGSYQLTYLKYIEEQHGDKMVVKEWTPDEIATHIVNDNELETEVIPNQLGKVPAVIAYNKRSDTRGIGVSDINDIADAQKYIYNCNSEMEQSIRLNTHPSLVIPNDTTVGVGAGALIELPDDLDPGLKPYVISFNGADTGSILAAINKTVEAIDKMANTGAVRAVESRTLSGVAMQTEFQLLNARLSEKADNLELAEEQIWELVALYENREWNGTIAYPGSFNISDVAQEFAHLKAALEVATDESTVVEINRQARVLLGMEEDS